MDNEIYLYREFWIKATETKLLDMTEDLIHDSRVQDFNKIETESDISKSDAKNVIAWINWVLPMLEPLIPVSDSIGINRLRRMKVMRSKMLRRITSTNN